ncbi:NADP-dependent oxidoreductase [Corynebacterium lowii]|uniref:Putative NADP-dependent oxidoreductase YfmJ n=1 Tax=Corynebacterium lowii TaxID=1544413 RepID=A0A0Q0Z5I8_9CORY|nr:NADP-dependent oxidoreductase [Corynebacterium lowii]KQB84759.1 putative NADP-dependent oxidoreductase YfmJ [Corynebacterium lowii]MDP9851662.1 NADPH-dependent curcumin reductase CurA [Corynebacterium lowii]
MHSNQIHLASRPTGWPQPENFRTVRAELPDLNEGEVRVRNEYISVDPYMRGRMSDAPSYIPPFELDAPMTGSAVGRVIESRADALPEGTLVTHQQGWRDVAQGQAAEFRAVTDFPGHSPSVYLGILGITGMTAYAGLTRIGNLKPGDTVFVSGAAGAVGSAVGQIARLLGAERVIGSAGGPEKAAMLTERYGFDVALDYKAAPIAEQLPTGIDLYFDNVGGDHLEAAIGAMNRFGRLVECGMISQYNLETPQAGPRNMTEIVKKSLRIEGFTLGDHLDVAPEFLEKAVPWLRDGSLVYEETVVEGLDNTVEAFLAMMRGANKGKMVVKV